MLKKYLMLFSLVSFNLNSWAAHTTKELNAKILDQAFRDFRKVLNSLENLAGEELDLYKCLSRHLMTPGHLLVSASGQCGFMLNTPWGGVRFKRKSDKTFLCRPDQICQKKDGTTKHLDWAKQHKALNLSFIKDGYNVAWILIFDEEKREWIKVERAGVPLLAGKPVLAFGSTISYKIGILDSEPTIGPDNSDRIDMGYGYRHLNMPLDDLVADFERRTTGSPMHQAWLIGVYRGALKRKL